MLGLLGGWVVLAFAAPRWLLVPPPQRALTAAEARIAATAEKLRWRSHDGLELAALRYRPATSRGRILVLHGIGSCKEHQADLSEALLQAGFEVLAVDLRAHGASGGEFTTFGFLEKRDLSALLDAYPTSNKTFVWGTSLGGAIGLQALEHDQRLRGGVIVSAFAALEDIALDRQQQKLGARWKWPWNYVMHRAQQLSGIPSEGVWPERACRSIEQPVFLVHGVLDENIGIEHARRNFRALASQDKVLWEVEGAGHDDLWEQGGEALHNAVEVFLDAHFALPD